MADTLASLVADGCEVIGAWTEAKVALSSPLFRLVVLDEITYPLAFRWIGIEEIVDAIRSRSSQVNVFTTGRWAPDGLVAVADTVTNMVNVRHHFDRGVLARAGIEY